jgi:hypothetical protein
LNKKGSSKKHHISLPESFKVYNTRIPHYFSATVHAQIHSHDESIGKMGCCVECRCVKGELEAEKTR